MERAPFRSRNGELAILVPVSHHPRLSSGQSVYLDVRARLFKPSSAGEIVAVKVTYRLGGRMIRQQYNMPFSLCAGLKESELCKRSMNVVNRLAGQ